MMRTIEEPARQIPVAAEVDVLVAGGGPAGIAVELGRAPRDIPAITLRAVLAQQDVYLG